MDAAMVRALFRREWTAASLAAAIALAGAGAALGRLLAARGLLPDPSRASAVPLAGIATLQDFALWLLARALPLPMAVAAVVVAVDRLASDGEAPWLASLVAGGLHRGRYVAAVAAAVASSLLALYLALAAGYVAGAGGRAGSGATLGLHMLRGLAGVAAFLASATLYGAACVTVARRRGAALALALVGVMGPIAAVGWLGADGGTAASPAVARLLAAAMPPAVWTTSAGALLRHALYGTVLLAILTRTAPRWLARHG
ncbi:MAG: hypothetical protein ACYC2G_08080 [Gemmatimonadaceae bacterium]